MNLDDYFQKLDTVADSALNPQDMLDKLTLLWTERQEALAGSPPEMLQKYAAQWDAEHEAHEKQIRDSLHARGAIYWRDAEEKLANELPQLDFAAFSVACAERTLLLMSKLDADRHTANITCRQQLDRLWGLLIDKSEVSQLRKEAIEWLAFHQMDQDWPDDADLDSISATISASESLLNNSLQYLNCIVGSVVSCGMWLSDKELNLNPLDTLESWAHQNTQNEIIWLATTADFLKNRQCTQSVVTELRRRSTM